MSISWRAGCSGGMFSAVKLCQSSSMSGPSATAKPISPRMAITSSMVWLTGWIAPRRLRPRRQGDVDALVHEPGVERRIDERALAAVDGGGDLGLDCVQRRAGGPPGLRIHAAEAAHHLGDAALLAELGDPQTFQRLGAVGGCRPPPARRRAPRPDRARQAAAWIRRRSKPRPMPPGRQAAWRRSAARRQPQAAASAPWAWSTSALKPSGSRTARSARILRSRSMPALLRPSMNCA